MPPSEDERAETRGQARKAVTFALEDLNKNLLQTSDRADTFLRRRSTLVNNIPSAETHSETLGHADDSNEDEDVYTYEKFLEACAWERVESHLYGADPHNHSKDLQQKMEKIAESYTKQGTTVGLHYAPLSAKAKTSHPAQDGVIDAARFKALCSAHGDAMFEEFKLRSICMQGALTQVEELHTMAKDMDAVIRTVYNWANGLGSRLGDLQTVIEATN